MTRSHRALGDRVGHKVQDKLGNKVADKVGDIHAVTRSHRAYGDRVRDSVKNRWETRNPCCDRFHRVPEDRAGDKMGDKA